MNENKSVEYSEKQMLDFAFKHTRQELCDKLDCSYHYVDVLRIRHRNKSFGLKKIEEIAKAFGFVPVSKKYKLT